MFKLDWLKCAQHDFLSVDIAKFPLAQIRGPVRSDGHSGWSQFARHLDFLLFSTLMKANLVTEKRFDGAWVTTCQYWAKRGQLTRAVLAQFEQCKKVIT